MKPMRISVPISAGGVVVGAEFEPPVDPDLPLELQAASTAAVATNTMAAAQCRFQFTLSPSWMFVGTPQIR
jgi:hypothetical protein